MFSILSLMPQHLERGKKRMTWKCCVRKDAGKTTLYQWNNERTIGQFLHLHVYIYIEPHCLCLCFVYCVLWNAKLNKYLNYIKKKSIWKMFSLSLALVLGITGLQFFSLKINLKVNPLIDNISSKLN